MGKTKKVMMDGVEITVKEYAEKHGVSYMCAYKRIKRQNKGFAFRPSKKPIVWRGKDGKLKRFDSISALARELGYSRQYVSRLVKKQEEKK